MPVLKAEEELPKETKKWEVGEKPSVLLHGVTFQASVSPDILWSAELGPEPGLQSRAHG